MVLDIVKNKRRLILCLWGVSLLLGVFLAQRTAFATSIPPDFLELKNTNDNFCQAMAVFNDVNLGIVNGYDGIIDKISLYFERHNYELSHNLALTLCAYSSSDDALYGDGTCDNNSGYQELTTIYNNPIGEQAMGWKELVLDSNFTFNPAYYYSLVASFNAYPCYGVNTSYGDWGRATSGTASSFMVQWGGGPINQISINTINDLTLTKELSFTAPYQLDSALPFLGYYSLALNYDFYQCGSSTPESCTGKIGSNLGSYSYQNSNIGTSTIYLGSINTNGYYQIKNLKIGYDDIGDGSIHTYTAATSSNVFQVNYAPNEVPTIYFPTSTISTSTPVQITCDTNDPWYQYSLCKLFVWLFVPQGGTFSENIALITAGIKNKPPIGYFYAIKSGLEGFESTTTKAFQLSTTSTNALAATVFTPLKTGISFIFWLVFGFWLFNRIRHFEL